ncbi:MAG TPA: HmuY family protein [Ferruginibacter sp.]|nr:HmuY family protein [Ferruginibacter sp.]HRE64089.1 HmuY family protein [Ferruginibacter sp.]
MRSTKLLLFVTLLAIGFSACRKKDAVDPDVLVNFETNAQGFTASEDSIYIKVKLTSAATAGIPVEITLTEQGVAYGSEYITEPAAVAGKINLTIPTGNNEASIKIKKTKNAYIGDEKIVFDIYSSGIPVIIGTTKQLALTFGQLLATTIPNTTLQGGGATYGNKVFFDLSGNRQTPVERTTWDLGFYMGSDDFRVILNSSVNMMVKQINKTDLNTVTAADTVGLTNEVSYNQAMPSSTQLAYIDYPDGDLTKTAIAAIAANAADNKVYIVNRGNGIGTPAPARGWKKIKVIRNASGGYTLQHADIASNSFTSVDIAKDAAYNFKYASFETGAISIEPKKTQWDFAWTYFANVTNFGAGEVPYLFQDVIILNRGVGAVKVMNTTKAYDAYTLAEATAATYSTAQNAIGSDWRIGGGPGVSPAVRTDRYYVIKDTDGNYYKVKFTALTDGGERGKPAFLADKL